MDPDLRLAQALKAQDPVDLKPVPARAGHKLDLVPKLAPALGGPKLPGDRQAQASARSVLDRNSVRKKCRPGP